MPLIFVCYRRGDRATITDRICDRLREAFGKDGVFKDVDNLVPASLWRQELDRNLNACDFQVVVIDPSWVGRVGEDGRRSLDDEDDWVRIEVMTTLGRGIPLLPLLVDGAAAPKAHELPPALRGLLDRQWKEVCRDPDFHDDMDRVVESIARELRLPVPPLKGRAAVARRFKPPGLEAVRANQADAFLQMLPGPRDAQGLPASVSFWKTWIDAAGRGESQPVGLLCGPSGCGKTSLVAAGLLPRLDRAIIPVPIEAMAEGTEAALGRKLADVAAKELGAEIDPSLEFLDVLERASAAAVRAGRTLLIVIDQLEQWLQARADHPDGHDEPVLARALRLCDGRGAMALLLVPEKSLGEAMDRLRLALAYNRNYKRLEPFNREHARVVLELLGRGYERWPDPPAPLPKEASDFLEQAVTQLDAESPGKITGVQLALFAMMVQDRPWNPATLNSMGGAQGVGVKFLDRVFSDPLVDPYRQGAEAVLRALLPPRGVEVKVRKSYSALLARCPTSMRPGDLDKLLNLLVYELRLITSTKPESTEAGEASGTRHYQLTHDFLVSSIRSWSAIDETRNWRGRVAARLREAADEWLAHGRDPRFLPNLWELATYLAYYARVRSWTERQAALIRAALRLLVRRALWAIPTASALLGLGLALFILPGRWRNDAATLRQKYYAAATHADAAKLIDQMKFYPYRRWLVPEFDKDLSEGQGVPSRAARNVAALIRLDAWDLAVKGLRFQPDSTTRTIAIHGLACLDVHGQELLKHLADTDEDVGVRRALILTLGEFANQAPRPPWAGELEAKLRELARDAPDPGVHSASSWALRKWGFEKPGCMPIPAPSRAPMPEGGRAWWVTAEQGHTLVAIEPLPSGTAEAAGSHPARRFAIATAEVTQDQFAVFINALKAGGKLGEGSWSPNGLREGCAPAGRVDWYLALAYCVWLSEKEKLGPSQYCYRAVKEGRELDEILEARRDRRMVSLPEDVLIRQGYRLPTEDEWEMACLAGSSVAFAQGRLPQYLDRYANFDGSRYANPSDDCYPESDYNGYQGHSKPVGGRKPNDWGLFDMIGNVDEWTLVLHPPSDRNPMMVPSPMGLHLGGSYLANNADDLGRGKSGVEESAAEDSENFGFRIARSLPPPAGPTAKEVAAVASPRR